MLTLLKVAIGLIAAGLAVLIGMLSLIIVTSIALYLRDHRRSVRPARTLRLAAWRKPSIQEKADQ